MTIPTVQVAGQPVGKVATGLMRLTYGQVHTPEDQAVELMKTAIDAGSNLFNSGAFYAKGPDRMKNLVLISRFMEKYPEYKDKFFLCVKGGVTPQYTLDASVEYLREELKAVNDKLKYRKIDMFEMGRVDTKVGIEQLFLAKLPLTAPRRPPQTMKNLLVLRDEGHFKYISLSEVSPDSIHRAAAIAPISAVEVEYSPFTRDIETNGVLDACKELDIPILAYSPLGMGFLGNTWKTKEDIPEGDDRRSYDRMSEEHFEHNMALARKLGALAEKKGITAAQLAIAWVGAQWEKIIPLPGSTQPDRVKQAAEAAHIQLSAADLKEIREVIETFDVKGVRYVNNAHVQGMLFG
ncbi:hypothetical protein JCM10207_000251 [Rhodosporidiobolus poonsookiae]